MKITKTQLRQIIKEELQIVLNEQGPGATAKDNRKYWTSASAKLQNIIRTIYSTLNDRGEKAQFLQQANGTINREFRVLAAQWKKGERQDDLPPEQEQAMQAAEKSSSSKPRETAAQEMGVSTQDLETINQKFKTGAAK